VGEAAATLPWYRHQQAPLARRISCRTGLRSSTATCARARDKAGITWPERKTPRTLHEIHSLAVRLYDAQGPDAQALLGHKSLDMTSVYREVRGAEWIEVKMA